MADFNLNTKNNDEWFTPRYITDALGVFGTDPCTSDDCQLPLIAEVNHTNDGLEAEWVGRVWLNPPYGRKTFDWMRKLSLHGNGIALIFARTETKGFHSEIWEKAHSLFFFKGRLKFYHKNGIEGDRPNAPSCLVAYGENNTNIIKHSGLNGRLVYL